jgi:hypothetical protein
MKKKELFTIKWRVNPIPNPSPEVEGLKCIGERSNCFKSPSPLGEGFRERSEKSESELK